MRIKSTLFKVLLGFSLAFFLICIAVAAAFFLWLHSWNRHSSFGLGVSKDGQLTSIFHSHKAAFVKLQQMAAEDARYGWEFNSPDFEGAELDERYRQKYEKDSRYAWYFKSPYFEGGKLREARWKEYKDLVSEISPGLSIGTDYNGAMRFVFAGGGGVVMGPGWAKGIEYVPGSRETNGSVFCGEWSIGNVTNPPLWQGLLLTNLDNAQSLPANGYLHQVESNWFIFYQRND